MAKYLFNKRQLDWHNSLPHDLRGSAKKFRDSLEEGVSEFEHGAATDTQLANFFHLVHSMLSDYDATYAGAAARAQE